MFDTYSSRKQVWTFAAPSSGVAPEAVARHFLPTDGFSLQPATRRAVVEACNVFSVAAARHQDTEVWAHLRPSLSQFLGCTPPKLDGDAIATIAAKRLRAEAAEERDRAIECARMIERAERMIKTNNRERSELLRKQTIELAEQMCDMRVGRIDAALQETKNRHREGYIRFSVFLGLSPWLREKFFFK